MAWSFIERQQHHDLEVRRTAGGLPALRPAGVARDRSTTPRKGSGSKYLQATRGAGLANPRCLTIMAAMNDKLDYTTLAGMLDETVASTPAGGAAMPDRSGTALRYFGDYELEHEIARGGMGGGLSRGATDAEPHGGRKSAARQCAGRWW
jgi:hypothetical protein